MVLSFRSPLHSHTPTIPSLYYPEKTTDLRVDIFIFTGWKLGISPGCRGWWVWSCASQAGLELATQARLTLDL